MKHIDSDADHYLYEFYDSEGACLYVGITADLGRRISSHSHTKDWWEDVAHVEVCRWGSRGLALAMEKQLIREKAPLYNVQWNRPRISRRSDVQLDVNQEDLARIFGFMSKEEAS